MTTSRFVKEFKVLPFLDLTTSPEYETLISSVCNKLSDKFKISVFYFEEFKVIEFIVLTSPLIITSNLSKLPSTVDDKIS